MITGPMLISELKYTESSLFDYPRKKKELAIDIDIHLAPAVPEEITPCR